MVSDSVILDKDAVVAIRLCGGFCDRVAPANYGFCADCVRGAEEDAKALKTENERHVAAWRQILVGKTAEDLDHPLGEFASMAGRFLEIAKSAIRGRSK